MPVSCAYCNLLWGNWAHATRSKSSRGRKNGISMLLAKWGDSHFFCAAAAWEDEDTIRGDMTAMCIPRSRSTSLGDLWPILERLIWTFEKKPQEGSDAAPEMHRDRVNDNSTPQCIASTFPLASCFPQSFSAIFLVFFCPRCKFKWNANRMVCIFCRFLQQLCR